VQCTPQRAWDLIGDITRSPEWSPAVSEIDAYTTPSTSWPSAPSTTVQAPERFTISTAPPETSTTQPYAPWATDSAGPVLHALGTHRQIGRAILHWFSGSKTELRRAIDLDCWFSVGPAMLGTSKGRSLVSAMPRNRIVLETDAPFAAIGDNPLFPWDIELAAEALCPIWQANLEQVVAQVRANEAALISL
jgi:hypothetical protein